MMRKRLQIKFKVDRAPKLRRIKIDPIKYKKQIDAIVEEIKRARR